MSDWRKCTEEEAALIASCRPDECCILYENAILKLSRARLAEIYRVAFKSAMYQACALAGITKPSQLDDYSFETIHTDAPYVRVTVTSTEALQGSAIGMVPDPRALH